MVAFCKGCEVGSKKCIKTHFFRSILQPGTKLSVYDDVIGNWTKEHPFKAHLVSENYTPRILDSKKRFRDHILIHPENFVVFTLGCYCCCKCTTTTITMLLPPGARDKATAKPTRFMTLCNGFPRT